MADGAGGTSLAICAVMGMNTGTEMSFRYVCETREVWSRCSFPYLDVNRLFSNMQSSELPKAPEPSLVGAKGKRIILGLVVIIVVLGFGLFTALVQNDSLVSKYNSLVTNYNRVVRQPVRPIRIVHE